MAVVAIWKCDRDGTMFEDKKQADAYDKMLELGEQFTALLESQIDGVDEKSAEAFGLLLANNKELIVQACKGKTEALDQLIHPGSVTDIGTVKVALS
ncbi:MAG: YebG family protein [Oceanicoccus sp.]